MTPRIAFFAVMLTLLPRLALGQYFKTAHDTLPYKLRQLQNYIVDRKLMALLDSVDEDPGRYRILLSVENNGLSLSNNLSSTNECSDESIINDALTGNFKSVSEALLDKNCKAPLATQYREALALARRRKYVDMHVLTGAWIPYGNNRLLGNHPIVGFGIGGGNKFIVDVTLECRFIDKSKEYYNVQYKGNNVTTNHFFGGYLGFDGGWNYLTMSRTRFYVLGGLAFDGFDATRPTSGTQTTGPQISGKKDDARTINSLNVNAGLGWRVFSSDGSYAGFELRNNFVKYSNPGGTSLDGNTFVVRFLYGVMTRDTRALRRLEDMVKL